MERRLITCPETSNFEVIEYERTELGALLVSCSRLERCGVECTRLCAARLDHRGDHHSGASDDLETGSLVCIVPYELDHDFDKDAA